MSMRTGAESDQRRFERLYAQHFDPVARYLLARTDRESAADALARTFEIAWRRLSDVPREPRPWLLGVARRVLAEQRRGDGRRDRLIERMAQTVICAADDPTDDVATRAVVLAAIEQLPVSQQDALLLVVWDGLTEREAAAVLGCSRGAVAVRLHRARKQLRIALASDNSAEPGVRDRHQPGEPRLCPAIPHARKETS